MIRSILYHSLCLAQSQRCCAQALGVSKGVVAKYVSLARSAGLDWSDIEPMDQAELEQRLTPRRVTDAARMLPDFAQTHCELARKGVTLQLLWQEYQANFLGQNTLQYSQFCQRYRQYVKTLKRSMRQVHRAGEKLFVDFAGPTLALTDGSRAHLFVAAMGSSHYTYALALSGQRTQRYSLWAHKKVTRRFEDTLSRIALAGFFVLDYTRRAFIVIPRWAHAQEHPARCHRGAPVQAVLVEYLDAEVMV